MDSNNNNSNKQENILPLLIKPMKKASLEEFLKEQFKDSLRRSTNEGSKGNLSKLAFMESLQLPLIISEHLLYAFTNNINSTEITQEKYIEGFVSLYGDDFDSKLDIISKIFDFDLDGVLNVDDITLFFAQFYIIDHEMASFHLIKEIIHVAMKPRNRLTISSFKEIIRNYNPDAFYLILLYFNQYSHFTTEQVNYFDRTTPTTTSTSKSQFDLRHSIPNNKKNGIRSETRKLSTRFTFIQPTNTLLSYLKSQQTMNNNNEEEKETNGNGNSKEDLDDNNDFDDIDFFEEDVTQLLSVMEPSKPNENIRERKISDVLTIHSVNTFGKFKTSAMETTNSYLKPSYIRSSTKSPIKSNHNPSSSNSAIKSYSKINSLVPGNTTLSSSEGIPEYNNPNEHFEIKVLYYTRSGEIRDCKILIINDCLFLHIFNNKTYKFFKLVNLKYTFVEEIEKCETLSNNILKRVKLSSYLNSIYKEIIFSCHDILEMTLFINHLKQLINERKVTDKYTIGKELYRGSQSHLYLGQAIQSGEKVAIKRVFQKQSEKSKLYEILLWEYDIMKFIKMTSHVNIVKVFDIYRTQESLYLILEYIQGGNLKSYLLENRHNLSLKRLKKIMFQIANSVLFLHSHGIVHRDLKPENILVDINTSYDDIEIKLIDFGFSRVLGRSDLANESYGTLYYASPEVLNKTPYSFKADVWSIGVIFYLIIVGTLPFGEIDKDKKAIHSSILNCKYTIPDRIDGKSKELIQMCLQIEAKDRPRMEDIVKLLNGMIN